MSLNLKVGSLVRVNRNHWQRGNEVATLVELCEGGRFMVEFQTRGVGFDDGLHLMLGDIDVELVESEDD